MGYAFSYLRPYGDIVGSSGGIASGPITFMRSFDQMCQTIAQGGTRRGAQMGVMRCTHPDLPFFIHAKNEDVSLARALMLDDPKDRQNLDFGEALEEAREILDGYGGVPEMFRNAVESHLSNFNISVTVTNEFMEAVENDEDFTFINPRTGDPHIATSETKQLYDWFGLGEYVEPGEELSVPATEIFERMAEGAHENGEPGILFIDKANEDHSFPTESTPQYGDDPFEMHTTNPCGEQWLMENEACNLGHINLSTVVDKDAPSWFDWGPQNAALQRTDDGTEYANLEEDVSVFLDEAIDREELHRRIEIGTQFLDNVVTMSDFEFGEDFQFTDIEETVKSNRKIGLGIMGLAQMFVQLGVKYGSPVSNEITRQIMLEIDQESKSRSKELALERGKFSNWEDSKYADPQNHDEWLSRHAGINPEEWPEGFPIRNHNTVTIAPTGTTSMTGNTSSGCEPIYSVAFFKDVGQDVQGDDVLVEFDDYFLRVLEHNGIDVDEVKSEAESQMRNNEWDGIDGLDAVPDEIGDVFVTTSELSGEEHALVQCAAQKGVDSAISKTVNFPNEATLSDVREVMMLLYENDAKGATIYRDGSRSKQVLTTRADNRIDDLDEIENPDERIRAIAEEHDVDLPRPESTGALGEKRERPDVLVGVTQRMDTGYGKMYVNINVDEDGRPFELFANIGNSGGFANSLVESLAKTISTALRAGVDPAEIADELTGIRSPDVAWDNGEQIASIPDAIGTALNRYLNGEVQRPQGVEPQTLTTDKNEQSTTDVESIVQDGGNPTCPECGSTLKIEEGCEKCSSQSCTYSKC